MEPSQQREEDLKEHINKDFNLKKELEDKLRYEDNPKEEQKLRNQIEKIDQTIDTRNTELQNLIQQRQQQEREALAREMPSVTFDELEIVTKFILGMPPASPEINFNLTGIKQKISKNKLTQEVDFLLTMGMSKVKEVGRFIEHNAVLRPDFPEKLTAGFVAEYQRLWESGLKGDDLFESLRQFSCALDFLTFF